MDQKQLFVVGAGVVGLTTAIRALEAGYKVIVFAEIFPTDPKSLKYTSFWAGANHLSFAESGALMEVLEKDTLNEFLDLIKQDPLVPAMTRTHFGLYETLSGAQERLHHLSQFYPDFRSLDASECPAGVVGEVVAGHSWTTICIDVPRYLPYLLERFFKLGGQAFRTTIPSLSSLVSANERAPMEVFSLNSSNNPQTPTLNPVAVINCTGLGAFSLQDVLDTDVYPTSGQTIIIRAPWVQPSITYYFANSDISYIIPRQSGDIVLGGSWGVDDWHATSRPEIAKAIKERGVRIYPELLPPGKREKGDINDLDVIAECVGLRTSRKTGVRLETTVLEVDGKKIPVIHNYGHGGGGYQSSWGSAKHVMKLLRELD
ncbi:D-amino-acid oxidase [Mycena sanguinolenta]|uniref:D-amino-acid oxidase n=1 Tax=Mycena sanguinolenta TaxID=230812 RepID=A0A8H7D9N6_9AGAR|nr:D-amino-acid oxidase [Mycena sanguinolenta]